MTGLEQLWVSQFRTALAKRSTATREWCFPSELALGVTLSHSEATTAVTQT